MNTATSTDDLLEMAILERSPPAPAAVSRVVPRVAVRDTPRAILSWVTATDRSTYFSMSVDGHTLYRLNYPLRLNRWYHSCQSWNGRTGEWQVWVNAERVGRGFHNLVS